MGLRFRPLRLGAGRVGSSITVPLFLAFCLANLTPADVWADPTIAQLSVGTVTSTTAVITWNTDIPSDSFISYIGTGESKVQNLQDDNLVTSHKLTLTGLKPETKYAFTVNSADTQGNNVSLSGTPFSTPSGPASVTPPPTPQTQDPAETTASTEGLLYTPPAASEYATGTLALEGSTIYFLMVKDVVKIPFSTLAAFTGLGYKLSHVQKIDVSNFRVSSGYIISSATEEHPWGSWLRAQDGTIYYSHSSGLIGVASMDVFYANGGTTDMIVPLNAADKKVLQANPNLPVLLPGDYRML